MLCSCATADAAPTRYRLLLVITFRFVATSSVSFERLFCAFTTERSLPPRAVEVKKREKARPQKRPVCDLNPQAKEVTSRNSSRMKIGLGFLRLSLRKLAYGNVTVLSNSLYGEK